MVLVLSAPASALVLRLMAPRRPSRQPEMQSRLFTVFILGSAFVEALALIGFVVTLIA